MSTAATSSARATRTVDRGNGGTDRATAPAAPLRPAVRDAATVAGFRPAVAPGSGCFPLLVLLTAIGGLWWWPIGAVAGAVSLTTLVWHEHHEWRGMALLVPALVIGQWCAMLLAASIIATGHYHHLGL